MPLEEGAAPATGSKTSPFPIRSLLVHVEAGAEASPRLNVAVDLARKFDADLVGLGAGIIRPESDPYGMLGGEWIIQVQALLEDNLKRAEAAFRARSAGLRAEWISRETLPAPTMARLSRSADLIVAGGAPLSITDGFRVAQTGELVLISGRPVLVAPPQGGKFSGEAVVVAWKDTRESRRAVSDSLPFLQAAKEVVVVEVCGKDDLEAALVHTTDVANFLRRHGVAARGEAVAARPEAVAIELNSLAGALDADLIVAGAYGHTRLGEWLFGGVTYDLLHAPERFVLLSH